MKRDMLWRHEFGYQLQEAIVKEDLLKRQGLLSVENLYETVSSDGWKVQNWIFYKNSLNIDDTHRISFKKTGITSRTKIIYFDSMYLKYSCRDLDSEALYVSRIHNGATLKRSSSYSRSAVWTQINIG